MRGLSAAVAIVLLLVVACGDDDESLTATPGSSPTPSSTTAPSTVTFTASPVPTVSVVSPVGSPPAEIQAFREFATEISAAIATKDTGFFTSRAQLTTMTCEGDEQLGPCSGHIAGEVISGIFGAAWQSDASAIFSIEDYTINLQRYFGGAVPGESDPYGSSTVRLYALAYSRGQDAPTFWAIATGILDVYPSTGYLIGHSERESHAFRFDFDGSEWMFVGEIVSGVSAVSAGWLSGTCSECYDYFELWPPSQ